MKKFALKALAFIRYNEFGAFQIDFFFHWIVSHYVYISQVCGELFIPIWKNYPTLKLPIVFILCWQLDIISKK